MLRTIKTPHLRPRLIAYTGTTAGSAANTISVGAEEGTFTNADNDEELDLALAQPFARAPVVIATPGADLADGVATHLTADPTASAISVTATGSDVGTHHALILGYDSTDAQTYGGPLRHMQSVKGTRRMPRIIAGQVSALGAVTIGGNQFSVTDNGTGDHTIVLTGTGGKRAFASTPVVVASPVTADQGAVCRVESATTSAINILTFDESDSADDLAFNFIAIGWDTLDEHRLRMGSSIQTQMRRPRILGFHITTQDTVTTGVGDGTVVDDGTGVFTLTYTDAFKREPIVVVCSGNSTDAWATVSASSATACTIETADASGSLGDADDCHIIVIGSDDADDF